MKHPIPEKRHKDAMKAIRKLAIAKAIDPSWAATFDGKRHKLSKGKVHCSCPMCSAKTARNGYKPSEMKKMNRLSSSLKEARLAGLY